MKYRFLYLDALMIDEEMEGSLRRSAAYTRACSEYKALGGQNVNSDSVETVIIPDAISPDLVCGKMCMYMYIFRDSEYCLVMESLSLPLPSCLAASGGIQTDDTRILGIHVHVQINDVGV